MDLSSAVVPHYIKKNGANIPSDEIFLSFSKFCIFFGIFQVHFSKFESTTAWDM